MFQAGGLLPYRVAEDGRKEYLLLEEERYNKRVLHVAGGRVERTDENIRGTIRREFIEEAGEWPSDLKDRVERAELTCPTSGYCLATVDVTDVRDEPPGNMHWVSEQSAPPVPMSWLASRCVRLSVPLRFGPRVGGAKKA
jgi:hypothetical protein